VSANSIAAPRAWALHRSAPRLVTLAAVLGGVLLLALFVRTFQTQPFVDFDAYFRTISDFRNGGHLYAQALTWRDAGYAVNSPGNNSQNADGLPFVYPPTFALAMVPLTLLPYKVALFAWFALIIGSIVGTAHVLLRMLLKLDRRYHAMLVVAVTAAMSVFQPVRGILATGNVDTLILFLLTLSLADYRGGKSVRAGVWLALAGLIKPTVGFVLVFFLWKRAWRVLVACGIVGSLLLGGSAIAIGISQTLDFVSVASYWSSPTFAVSPVNQAAYGLLLRLLTVNPYTVPVFDSTLLATILRLAVIGGVLFALARAIRPSRAVSPMRLTLEYGLVLIGMLLASPLSEDIHYTYLVLPLIAIGCTAFTFRSRRSAQLVAAALVGIYLYLSLPLLGAAKMAFYAFYVAPVTAPRLFLTGVHLYALVALLCVALITLRQQTLVDRDAIPHG
jgi:hypothetical protein